MSEAKQAPGHRSYSQINQLRTCGYQYKLARLDGVPEKPSVPALAGRVIHAASEEIDNLIASGSASLADQGDLLAAARAAAEQALATEIEKNSKHYPDPDTWKRFGRATSEKPKGEDLEWYREVGIPQALQAYVDWRKSTNDVLALADIPGFGPAIEVPFNYYDVDGQLIHGYIDRIFTDGRGGYFPLDLKTGQKPSTDEQLGLYSQSLREALDWNIQYGYYLYMLKTGKAKVATPDISHWTREKLHQVYEPATRAIKLGVFIPSPGDNCHRRCSVSDHCPFARAAL